MRISVETSPELVRFCVFPEKADRKRNPNFGEFREFVFKSTGSSSFGKIHPDRLALVAILNTLPFCEERLHISWPISSKFLEVSKVISRISISADEGLVTPISKIESGRHALSFSGGADSMAALAVMPQSTESIFMLRSKRGTRTLYDSEAAEESCRQLRNLGFIVHIVESDFEYLREPIGFPTDLAVSSPAILLAESRNFASIAFGTILESAFGTSGVKFRNYSDSSHYRLWKALFESVGLGYSLPVAGVSEVGTAKLCIELPIGRFHQSCIRGKWGNPCNSCWKCFRKNTLISALEGRPISDISEKAIRKSKEVRKHLLQNCPIKHEGVITYSLERASGGGDVFTHLRRLTRVGSINTDWMGHWYPPSISLIDDCYSKYTAQRLRKFLGEMTRTQILDLHGWFNEDNEDRENRLAALSKLL